MHNSKVEIKGFTSGGVSYEVPTPLFYLFPLFLLTSPILFRNSWKGSRLVSIVSVNSTQLLPGDYIVLDQIMEIYSVKTCVSERSSYMLRRRGDVWWRLESCDGTVENLHLKEDLFFLFLAKNRKFLCMPRREREGEVQSKLSDKEAL